SEKRDSRSDVTQCAGVLFYLVTGKFPGFIRDANDRKPHQRIDLIKAVKDLSSDQLAFLRRIFDIGFEFDPRGRWQSAASLKAELAMLADQSHSPLSYDARLADLHSRLSQSSIWSDKERFAELDSELKQHCLEIGQKAHRQF